MSLNCTAVSLFSLFCATDFRKIRNIGQYFVLSTQKHCNVMWPSQQENWGKWMPNQCRAVCSAPLQKGRGSGVPPRASAPSPAEQGGRLEAAPRAAARKDRRVLKAFCSFETSGCYFSLPLDLTIPMDWEVSVAKLVLCLWNGTQVPSQHPGAGARSTAGLVLAGMMMLTSLDQRRTEKGQSIKLLCFSMIVPRTSELNSMYN